MEEPRHSDLRSVRGIRPLTEAEKAVLDEFCREMREHVIRRSRRRS